MNARRILLADDEPHITHLVAHRLKAMGHEVRVARDGEEAWTMVQEWVPDLLITDLQMPYINGLDLITNIRKQPSLAGIPVIVLTARGYVLDDEQIRQARIAALLSKPFSVRRLAAMVSDVLSEHSEPRRAA